MWDILRDPLWQFVGALIAVIALVIALVQVKRKRLAYEIVASSSLLSLREEVGGKIKILYEGAEVERVYLVVVRILNSGNVPIESQDYERPLRFSFGPYARILSFEITEVRPSSLQVEIDNNENHLTVSPLLLNARDSFSLKILVSGYTGDIKLDTRIVGVKGLEKGFYGDAFSLRRRLAAVVGLLGFAIWGMFLERVLIVAVLGFVVFLAALKPIVLMGLWYYKKFVDMIAEYMIKN